MAHVLKSAVIKRVKGDKPSVAHATVAAQQAIVRTSAVKEVSRIAVTIRGSAASVEAVTRGNGASGRCTMQRLRGLLRTVVARTFRSAVTAGLPFDKLRAPRASSRGEGLHERVLPW